MFDLSSIKENNESVLELVHPSTGEKIGATLSLAGPEHPKRKAIEFSRQRLLRKKLAKAGRLEMTDPADDEEFEIDMLSGCTLGWSGFAENGKPVEFSAAKARELYESQAWLRRQAQAFMADAVNFISAAPTP